MTQLFTPYALGPLTVRNRIAIAPMCQYSAENGDATDWHMIHLGHLALSGAGALFIEATAVEPEGRITPTDLGLWSDQNEIALHRRLTATIGARYDWWSLTGGTATPRAGLVYRTDGSLDYIETDADGTGNFQRVKP